MKGKNVLCHMVDQQPLSTPTAKVYNGGGQRSEEVELYADQQHSSIWGGCGDGWEHSSRLTGGRTLWLEGTTLCLGGALWRASHSTWCPQTKSGLSSWGWGRSPCRCSTPSGGSGRQWRVQPLSCGRGRPSDNSGAPHGRWAYRTIAAAFFKNKAVFMRQGE